MTDDSSHQSSSLSAGLVTPKPRLGSGPRATTRIRQLHARATIVAAPQAALKMAVFSPENQGPLRDTRAGEVAIFPLIRLSQIRVGVVGFKVLSQVSQLNSATASISVASTAREAGMPFATRVNGTAGKVERTLCRLWIAGTSLWIVSYSVVIYHAYREPHDLWLIRRAEIGTHIVFAFELLDAPVLVHNLPTPYCVKSAASGSLHSIRRLIEFAGHDVCVPKSFSAFTISPILQAIRGTVPAISPMTANPASNFAK